MFYWIVENSGREGFIWFYMVLYGFIWFYMVREIKLSPLNQCIVQTGRQTRRRKKGAIWPNSN
jgi:hypothetical protein